MKKAARLKTAAVDQHLKIAVEVYKSLDRSARKPPVGSLHAAELIRRIRLAYQSKRLTMAQMLVISYQIGYAEGWARKSNLLNKRNPK